MMAKKAKQEVEVLEVLPAVVIPIEFTELIKTCGLELTETEAIKQSYMPFYQQLGDIKERAKAINWENPGIEDEKLARALRLETVKIRTGSKDVKESRKNIHSLKANLEQASWNLIKATCELDEERFELIEKTREIAEKKRIDTLRQVRSEELQPYREFIMVGTDITLMNDEEYAQYLTQLKDLAALKIAKAKLAQEAEEKLLAIKRLHDTRKSAIIEFWSFIPAETKTADLGIMEEKEWKKLFKQLSDAKAAHTAEQVRIQKENDRLNAERFEQMEKNRIKQELRSKRMSEVANYHTPDNGGFDLTIIEDGTEEQYQEYLAIKMKAHADHTIEKQQAEEASLHRIQKELAKVRSHSVKLIDAGWDQEDHNVPETSRKWSKDEYVVSFGELTLMTDEDLAKSILRVDKWISDKIEAENLKNQIAADNAIRETKRIEAERSAKKALMAPDKEKLELLAKQFEAIVLPDLKTEEAATILANIQILKGKIVTYIIEKSNTL